MFCDNAGSSQQWIKGVCQVTGIVTNSISQLWWSFRYFDQCACVDCSFSIRCVHCNTFFNFCAGV